MKMQKSKIKIYLVFVIVLFVCVLFFSLKNDFKDILHSLYNVNYIWLLFGIVFVFLSKYLIGLTTFELGKKENKKISMSKMQQIALIYHFYAGITPSAIGGEAFEIFYLKQSGISLGGASNITMQKFILYEIALIIVNTVAVIINFFTHIVVDSSFVGSAITLNFIVNFVMLGGCFLITYNKWVKNFILQKGVFFLNKIKIIKDVNKSRDKIDEFMVNFDEGAKSLRSDRHLLWKIGVYNIFSLFFLMIAAWPIARAMHITNISFINLFILATYAKMMCSLIVTPGASGAAEYCFIYLFTGLIEENDIMTYMLIWRFATYYVPLVVGGILALSWERRKVHEETTSSKS